MSGTHVRILRQARMAIETGREQFICIAVEFCPSGQTYELEADQIIDQIHADLEGDYTYDMWLVNKKGIWQTSGQKLVEGRLAWIDALIEYWKDRP